MKYITITNPDGHKVRINIAYIVFYQEYHLSVVSPEGMTGTQIVLAGHYDQVQFSQEKVNAIDSMIRSAL